MMQAPRLARVRAAYLLKTFGVGAAATDRLRGKQGSCFPSLILAPKPARPAPTYEDVRVASRVARRARLPKLG
jgi:hypothetical protein